MSTLDLRGENVELRVTAGDRLAVTLDYEGVDVSASTWEAKLLDRPGGNVLATFAADVTAAGSGTVVLSIDAAATAALTARTAVWYVERTTGSVVSTVVSGGVKIDPQGNRGAASTTAQTVTVRSATLNVSVSAAAAATPGVPNIDGGSAASVYGGTTALDGGDA